MIVATGCDDKYVRVWEHSSEAHSLAEGWTMTAELGRLHDDVHAHTLSALSVAFDPTDEFAVSGGADTAVKLWRLNDKELALDMLGHLDWVTKVVRATMSPHTAHPQLLVAPSHTTYLARQTYSPDGMMLASSSYDETVKLWRVSDGDEILTLNGHTNFVTCAQVLCIDMECC